MRPSKLFCAVKVTAVLNWSCLIKIQLTYLMCNCCLFCFHSPMYTVLLWFFFRFICVMFFLFIWIYKTVKNYSPFLTVRTISSSFIFIFFMITITTVQPVREFFWSLLLLNLILHSYLLGPYLITAALFSTIFLRLSHSAIIIADWNTYKEFFFATLRVVNFITKPIFFAKQAVEKQINGLLYFYTYFISSSP